MRKALLPLDFGKSKKLTAVENKEKLAHYVMLTLDGYFGKHDYPSSSHTGNSWLLANEVNINATFGILVRC